MEMFSKDLKNQAMKIINHEMKEMIRLTNEETAKKPKICYICEKEFSTDKKYCKVIVITQENLEEPLKIIAI